MTVPSSIVCHNQLPKYSSLTDPDRRQVGPVRHLRAARSSTGLHRLLEPVRFSLFSSTYHNFSVISLNGPGYSVERDRRMIVHCCQSQKLEYQIPLDGSCSTLTSLGNRPGNSSAGTMIELWSTEWIHCTMVSYLSTVSVCSISMLLIGSSVVWDHQKRMYWLALTYSGSC